MKSSTLFYLTMSLFTFVHGALAQDKAVTVSSLAELVTAAAGDGRQVTMAPGVYRMADYLTAEVLEKIGKGVDRSLPRPPVPMLVFEGKNNRFDLRDVIIEIDTSLYAKLPQRGYTRCLIVQGSGNTIDGLTLRNTGPNQGSGGNILSVAGEGNTLENVTLQVHGSFPWGYGDLLGKGGPNLVNLQKQSGIQVLGSRTLLRRCKVFSRALGHCFYIQAGDDIRIEDCLAEGVMRSTTEMLADTSGPAADLGFKSVYVNRDGRYQIQPGYTKSLVEDGFRTYGGAGNITLVNCTAIHTRSGFEIGAKDDSPKKTYIENCLATGCERGYLLGSNVVVRRSRGDISHGPLLYLRGGLNSDIELELAGVRPESTVHAIATLAGSGHRVRLTCQPQDAGFPRLPLMLGFGMPAHAEMASPILPDTATGITLLSELPGVPVLTSSVAKDCHIEAAGMTLSDEDLRKSPGDWGAPIK
ncbi:MAG: right-handed parallel beta-helix repeat-containing protein [Luteolibacter sp.]